VVNLHSINAYLTHLEYERGRKQGLFPVDWPVETILGAPNAWSTLNIVGALLPAAEAKQRAFKYMLTAVSVLTGDSSKLDTMTYTFHKVKPEFQESELRTVVEFTEADQGKCLLLDIRNL